MTTTVAQQRGMAERGSFRSRGRIRGVALPGLGCMSTTNDKSLPEHLVEGFRNGDAAAVAHVYDLFARPVATVARSIVGADQALIDDVVQQTFTKAWRAADSFDSSRSFAPWLYTIARRTAIDNVRAERRPTRGDHDEIVDIAVEDRSMDQTWEAYHVRLAIEELPEEEQQVVQLSHSFGFTHHQISDRLGVPVGTVKSRSHRAHKKLATLLAHLQKEPPASGHFNSGATARPAAAPRRKGTPQ